MVPNPEYYASANTTISTYDYLLGTTTGHPSITPFNFLSTGRTATFPSGIPDGLYYIGWILDSGSHVMEFDENNNIEYVHSGRVRVDGTAPSNPTGILELGGAPNNTWQSIVSNPNFDWWGASDGTGSGVNGYYVYWGPSSSGTSSYYTTISAYNPSAVANPSTNYLRVRAKDDVGNLSSWKTLFTFRFRYEQDNFYLPLVVN